MSGVVGFTTTIPVEVIFASGLRPCDLNNVFVTHPDPQHYVALAEREGFPRNMCSWIKGIYGVVVESKIDTVITVLEGDCSNTRALAEVLAYKGVRIVPFSFPYDRRRESLSAEIGRLADAFAVDERAVAEAGGRLTEVRKDLAEIDRMTWEDRLVTGFENHLWQLCASDMEGDYEAYGARARAFIAEARKRRPYGGIPVGYIGVPPINPDLHAYLESRGCRIAYNEVQRQFALPYFEGDITDRYLRYTYPYGIFARIADIKEEIARRRLAGVVHYVQAFCYRMVEDIILRDALGVPVLTIEGDAPQPIDTRTKTRLDAFSEMLKGQVDGED